MTSRAKRDKTNPPTLSPRTLASAVVFALASLSANVDAAGLGRLTVQSGLGQPLRAEVEVTALSREEAQSLSARLASPDAFRQAGLEYNPALGGLRFAVEPRGGRTFVRITSAQPINEPFVDLLVELNWATGKFVREYTFLLDPPELRAQREAVEGGASRTEAVVPPAAAPAAAPSASAAGGVRSAPVPERAAPAARQVPSAPAQAAPAAPAEPPAARTPRAARPAVESSGGGTVDVRRGDTLAGIARAARPDGVSLDQAMVAIYRANPSAFIGNLNLVREGARLSIPDRNAMASVDPAEATRQVRLQSADFAAYRQRIAAAPRSLDGPRSGQTAAGSVGGQVEAGAGAPGDQLRLSKPGAVGGDGTVGSQSSRAGEREVARDAALREANSRINDLEKNVNDLQKLLELRNRSMADLQKQLEDARTAQKAVTGAVAAAPSAAATPAPAPAAKTEMPAPAPAAKAEPAAPEAPRADAAPVADAAKAAPAEPPKAEAPPVPAAPVASAPATETPQAAAPKPAAPAPVAEPSFVDDLLENPFLLPGLGGIALLGAGYGWYAMRRRRKVEKFEDSLIAADAFTANSLFGSTGGQSVDTSNSVFAPNAAGAAVDVHSTEVDPIAEADVYIAYGREAQAEEILKEALKRQPERQAIRAKLLEIYSGRKDAKAFEAVAREMHDMTGGTNEEWPKVVTMGLSIDPSNPLYGGGTQQADASAGAAAMAAGAFGAAAAAAGASVATARPETTATDLDLSDLSFDAPSMAEAPSADTVGMDLSKEEEIASLDFDLNIDTRIDRAAAQDDARISDTVTGSDLGLGSQEPIGATLEERFDLPSLDLGANAGAESPEIGALDLDLPSLETLAAAPAGGAPELDLSPISLDLEPATVEAAEGEASAGGAGRWQEMATKLDLASAYEEIGDKEGARELLQEVIKGGDNGQQQKARAMLSKIG